MLFGIKTVPKVQKKGVVQKKKAYFLICKWL